MVRTFCETDGKLIGVELEHTETGLVRVVPEAADGPGADAFRAIMLRDHIEVTEHDSKGRPSVWKLGDRTPKGLVYALAYSIDSSRTRRL